MSSPNLDPKSETSDLIAKRPMLFWTLRFAAILGVAGFFMAAAPGTKACCAIPAICPDGSGFGLAVPFAILGIAAHWLQKSLFRIPISSALQDLAVLIPGALLYFAARQIHLAFAC